MILDSFEKSVRLDHKDDHDKVLGKSMQKIDEVEERSEIDQPKTFDTLIDQNLEIIAKMV